MKASALKLHKAFYDCKAKTASFRISGFISPHKPFCQLFHIHSQFVSGDIFENDFHLISPVIEIQVCPGSWKCILGNIDQKIFQTAVSLFSVQLQLYFFFRDRKPTVDLCFF